jgi:class 3 adenylate cyclase
MASGQPSGTVTLVFTDIEGSTRLLEELGTDAYREALAEHRRVVREAFGQGYEVDYEGDAFFYAFAPRCRRRVHRASRTPPSRSTRRR